ncbi:MAG: DUF3147 domain-containing protein [Methanotrichaceae archaeon]|nr:DUF3147 domain-containing protein [Methanotrichaceae archaeon]
MHFLPYLDYWADSELRLVFYFILGGAVTAITAYYASQGRGTVSAFIATLPLLTVLSFVLIYVEGGKETVLEYAQGLLIFTPPWLCYVATVMLGMERLGIFKSLGLGILLYVILSAVLSHLFLGTKM